MNYHFIGGEILWKLSTGTESKIQFLASVLLDPAGYLDFISLEMNAAKIITDSGGIQKEAYILQKPCITLRSETEWIETVIAGWNIVVNPNTTKNYSEIIESFSPGKKYIPVFGENVTGKMISLINKFLN
jgi:UDP-N-acetylglucosamine 2-epimerase